MNAAKANKIRVLYLVSRLRRVGPIFQLYNIVKNLRRDRFAPRIITLSPERQESLIDRFRDIDVECDSIGLSSIASMVFGPRRIQRLLQERPADLIHACDYRSILLCVRNFARIPRVVTCRQAFDYTHFNLDGTAGPITARIMIRTLELACRKCERVVAVSDFVRRSAGTRLADRTAVIHNGVDRDLFATANNEQKSALRSRLNLPHDKHIFLSAGLLSRRKDPVTVIRGFLMSEVAKSCALVLLGDGPLRKRCSDLAGPNGNVRVVGFVDNVREYMRAADTFVSASLTEGCPNVVMEAMACGLPVVLSGISPHREILDYDGRAGLMFEADDASSLSQVFSKSLKMDRSQQCSAALGIIKNHLNAENMSSKYQELYVQLHDCSGPSTAGRSGLDSSRASVERPGTTLF